MFTFCLPVHPASLKAGYCHLKVNTFIPNPLRCYTCQKFGHGSKSCNNQAACYKCAGKCEDSDLCNNPPTCVNCSGNHPSSSKDCPTWKLQFKISQLKHQRNIPFSEAKKIVLSQEQSGPTYSDAVSASIQSKHVSCHSVGCQTDYTWARTSAPTLLSAEIQPRPSLVTCSSQTSDSKDIRSLQTSPEIVTSQTHSSNPEPNVKPASKQKLKQNSDSVKKTQSGRTPKGEKNHIQIYNKFGSLDDMDVSEQSHGRTHSLSPSRRVRGRSPVYPPKK